MMPLLVMPHESEMIVPARYAPHIAHGGRDGVGNSEEAPPTAVLLPPPAPLPSASMHHCASDDHVQSVSALHDFWSSAYLLHSLSKHQRLALDQAHLRSASHLPLLAPYFSQDSTFPSASMHHCAFDDHVQGVSALHDFWSSAYSLHSLSKHQRLALDQAHLRSASHLPLLAPYFSQSFSSIPC